MNYFFLGNTPDLSLLELKSLFGNSFVMYKEGIATSTTGVDVGELDRLGGTRKVATQLAIVKPSELIAKLTELIIDDYASAKGGSASGGKNVAITDYANTDLTSSEIISIKKAVQATRPIRFVSTDTGEHELLMLAHQHVSEFNLLPSREGITIARTSWIYDAESWVKRDRKKPYRDIKRGMLPPKLARIMVNLGALGKAQIVYDPFCGTGTILSEALLSGCRVIGSDNDAQAVEGARANCEWLADVYKLPQASYELHTADVSHPPVKSVDTIVTEPYMGPLVEGRYIPPFEKLKNIARGLDKLYRGAFKAWHAILPPGGRIVMSIPRFVAHNRSVETISIDTLRSLGYNCVVAVPYGKPGAVVIRNITILEKI